MNRILKLLALIIFSTLVLFSLSSCQFLQNYAYKLKPNASPVEVYHRAWSIINNEYFDSNFNNEDWKYWEHRYDKTIKTDEDCHVAIQTMIESLNDRYTRLLKPDKFKEQDIDIEAKISGIGIQIAQKDDKIIIVSVLEDTPAEKANLQSKDKIIQVDTTSTKGLDLKDVANLIRGKIGTYVKLTVLREDKEKVVNVVRDEIKIKSIKTEKLDNNIAYIKLISFISQNADEEMEDAVLKASDASAIILDLRNNHGGLLPNAISIANIFIDRGAIIVSIIDRNGHKQDFHSLTKSISDKPLVVLINGSSASASEILGGALKDHNRAILIGETTFGKGMVQKIFDLPNGSGINVTVSKYLTPNGIDINQKGITPDVEVELTIDDLKKDRDVQLEEAKKIALQAIKNKQVASKK